MAQNLSNPLDQGVPEIEVAVITEAGSFGSPLGALTRVVPELAERIVPEYKTIEARTLAASKDDPGEADKDNPPLEYLIVLDVLVDEIKRRHRQAAERAARRALDPLKTSDEGRDARFVKSLNP